MIFSTEQLFSDDQNLTSTGASTNYIDLGAAGTPYGANGPMDRDIGKGNGVGIVVQLTADAGGTSPTMQVDIEVDDNTGFSSATTVASTTFTGGVEGDQSPIVVLPNGIDERYVRLNYTLGGTSPDYTVTAGITCGVQTNG